jgi:hypothetical protein
MGQILVREALSRSACEAGCAIVATGKLQKVPERQGEAVSQLPFGQDYD